MDACVVNYARCGYCNMRTTGCIPDDGNVGIFFHFCSGFVQFQSAFDRRNLLFISVLDVPLGSFKPLFLSSLWAYYKHHRLFLSIARLQLCNSLEMKGAALSAFKIIGNNKKLKGKFLNLF